jgi:hypothetical protein
MDKAAVDAARECLDRAKAELVAMENADSFKKIEEGWSDFLTMANRVYVKLEQGAKVSGPSKGWFGLKIHERKVDPLLKYIKNARDVDEHGLQQITDRQDAGVGVKFPTATNDAPVIVKSGRIAGGQISFELEDPNTPVTIRIIPSTVKLVEVINRGVRYQPPEEHMGQPIPQIHPIAHPHPVAVARLTVSHLDALIGEAKSRVL